MDSMATERICLTLVLCCMIWFEVSADTCTIDQKSSYIFRRFDCFPEIVPQIQEHCESRGCCYDPNVGVNDDIPWCFYPSDYPTYHAVSLTQTSYGYTGHIMLDPAEHHPFNPMISNLTVDVYLEEANRLRFRVRDPAVQRFEVPINTPNITKAANTTLYDLNIQTTRFGIIVSRTSTGTVIFNSTIAPMIFANQFLQISTSLPSTYIYGLGERDGRALISTNWQRNVYWARDQPPYPEVNLYGDHPFYICIENDGNAHGVFFLNSNAKEVVTQPTPALTWRSIGGILDFYIFLGPTPESVVEQYTGVVGKTFLPPMWSLGFHLCRWGYNSSSNTLSIVQKMQAASIPQDVQWNDIDYMENHLDFTYNPDNFGTLPVVVDYLHQHGQHYVMIIDPGISNQQPNGTYPAYEDGIASGIFIMDPENKKPIEGIVWPGKTVFPDFSHPGVEAYWQKQLSDFHSKVQFDGVWIDMNEPSNLIDGSTTGCPASIVENPVYMPKILGNSLSSHTLCASAVHYHGVHYNYHSLTGLMEMKATSQALVNIRKKRPFVISRSTFSSAGQYGGHWSGDVTSSWADMKQSIVSVINFNMFGIPMVGADICGFSADTTEELCTRWMQLGAFYPFSRNHNSLLSKGQAPVDFSETAQRNMRDALMLRYSYLPYLYSLFVSSHLTGSTVARGLFFEFPQDKTALSIDEQFMWGSGLMISPVLELGARILRSYFPAGYWYYANGPFGKKVDSNGDFLVFSVTMSDIPVHIRGGSILPTQQPSTTTTRTRLSAVYLIVAPDQIGNAEGFLFWDDGESLGTYANKMYLNVEFILKNNTLLSKVITSHEGVDLTLSDVYFFNAPLNVKSVFLNGNSINFNRAAYDMLHFSCSVSLSKPFQAELK